MAAILKDKADPFRLMGFGHRVYKNFDPRAKIIKVAADEVLSDLGVEDPVLDIAKGLAAEALSDEYFALGRLPGWIAQWKEMRARKEPIGRPRQVYIGENYRDFKAINNR